MGIILGLWLIVNPVRAEARVEEMAVFVDQSRSMTLADARQARFLPAAGTLNLGFTDAAVWIRVRASGDLLQIAFPLIDRVDLYQETSAGTALTSAGITLPYQTRLRPHRTILFKLTEPSRAGEYMYLRIVNGDSMQIPLRTWREGDFQAHDHNEQFALGIYYGILAVMSLFNLFLFFTLRDRTHLVYVLYVTLFGLFLFSQYGLAFEYFWPDWTWAARRMNPFLASLLEASILLFTRSFLDIRHHSSFLDRLLKMQIALNTAGAAFAFVLPLGISALFVVTLGLTACILVSWSAALALLRGFRPARFFVLAFGFVLLGAVVYALKTFGALPVNFFTDHGMQIGSAVEVTLLTLALVDRMNTLQRQRRDAEEQNLRQQKEALERQQELTASYARLLPRESLALLGKQSITEVRAGDQTEKEMTVLFSDIRSFTTLSEQMSPGENFNFLNSYLRRMNPHIRRHRGYIDKYLGDGILALFPSSSLDAIKAAVEMRLELHSFNEHRTRSGFVPVETGTGIHTGRVMLGALGESERLELTVISDTVNTASRIEGLTRTYGGAILISESSFYLSEHPDSFSCRLVDRVQLRGRRNTVAVYEVLDGLSDRVLDLRRETRSVFERGVHAFHSEADYRGALNCFEQVLRQDPLDTAAQLYLERSLKMLGSLSTGAEIVA